MASDTENQLKPKQQNAHPVGVAIDNLLHRTRDIMTCSYRFIPEAARLHNQRVDDIKARLDKGEILLASANSAERIQGISDTIRTIREVNRISNSRTPDVLETSLFIGMFSALDAYMGQLLFAIYRRKPELIKRLGKEVPVSEVCQFSSIDEFLNSVLEDMIETFRRKSYVEQFTELENIFQVPLRKFPGWPAFVEAAQRRNLFTHCDGIVSTQYLDICKKEGFVLPEPVSEGDKLKLGSTYFLPVCELVMEVGLKLGQTLWRKVFPDEVDDADKHLNDVIYDALHFEKWSRAQVFAEFATSDPICKKSNDLNKKFYTSNLAIAYKFGGKEGKAKDLLQGTDWSASLNEFKLCESVLNERYEDASSVMKSIGKKGTILGESSYHTWPLFRDFRQNNIFLTAYEEIYGYPFTVELSRAADVQERQISKMKEDDAVTCASDGGQ